MGTVEHVIARLDAPQLRAVQFVAVIHRLRSRTAASGILLVGGSPLHDDFIFTISVHVAESPVVGRIVSPMAFVLRGGSQRHPHRLVGPGLLAHLGLQQVAILVIHLQFVVGRGRAATIAEVGLVDDISSAIQHRSLSRCVRSAIKFILHTIAVGLTMAPRHKIAAAHAGTTQAQ